MRGSLSCFHLLQLDNVPIYQQLQIEEALLRADSKNWCIINKGSPPAIVMGISGKAEELIDFEALAAKPMPVVRRFSGGGTVVVDEETAFVTWILNSEDIAVACCPKKVLEWTAALYKDVFRDIDFRLAENDYAIGHRKCGGNAQYMRKGRWLHHTSFLWDYKREHMQLLKMPPKMPEYRLKRPHEEFLCRLRDHFDDYEVFSGRLLGHISQQLQLVPTSLASVQPILEIPHRCATAIVSLKPACQEF